MTEKIKIYFKQIKDSLDKVSPTYCVAKWEQVTIHLATGQTHSCHHPPVHKIPLDEIASNPSALHNTNFKKQQRKLMLEGERPPECDYCWRAEDAPGDHHSDRIKKSGEAWALPRLEQDSLLPWDADVIPSYVEVSFSNVCNFGCTYCSPDISSVLMQDAVRHGPIQLSRYKDRDITYLKKIDRFPIPHREHNPYVEAWWRWWPELYPKLKVFRITGGEPLLSKETFRTLDWIIEHPNPDLDLAINTNLGVDKKILDNFLEKCNEIVEKNLVKSLKIFTSCDTSGEQAEYIRHGLDYKEWYNTLWNIILKYPKIEITTMVTFNLLSIPRFKLFLQDILALRQVPVVPLRLNGTKGVLLDFPYLRHPRYLSALLADSNMLSLIGDCIKFMNDNMSGFRDIVHHHGFYQHEIHNLERIYNIIAAEKHDEGKTKDLIDFYLFTTEIDRRNGTDFCKTFPEMVYFYDRSKKLYLEWAKKETTE